MKEQKCLARQSAMKAIDLARFALSNSELSKVKGGTDYIVDEQGNFIVEDEVVGI